MIGYPINISDFVQSTPPKGPSTYLNGNDWFTDPRNAGKPGWPNDQKAEDTFELPPQQPLEALQEAANAKSEQDAQKAFLDRMTTTVSEDHEYHAEYGNKGEAILVKFVTTRAQTVQRIASFDTFADAQKAAEALNNHEGF